MTDLEQIEAKHSAEGDHGDGCFDEDGLPHDPCDVVKLARALDEVLEYIREGGHVNRGFNSVQDAERTLEEVAGESA